MTQRAILETSEYFDGTRLHTHGPYCILIENGVCQAILAGKPLAHAEMPPAFRAPEVTVTRAVCVTPALAEAHCHLFLDGDELNDAARAAYLKAPRETMLNVARRNIAAYRDTGITAIRDAGDVHGINLVIREEARMQGMVVIAAGTGLRRPKRYGSFMAREVADDLTGSVHAIGETADAIKIVLTGIIDFSNGVVKGTPQFTLEETRLIVETAHALGKKTFAHCSGLDGLRIAAEAGVDSIEHGFFMNRDILDLMARNHVAWTPTIIPVHFQWEQPQYGGWDEPTRGRLRAILDNHAEHLRHAERMGIDILAGSDGGSFGVRHAAGLIDELRLLREAGLSIDTVLASATSTARRHFGIPGGAIAIGQPADCLALATSPQVSLESALNSAFVTVHGFSVLPLF